MNRIMTRTAPSIFEALLISNGMVKSGANVFSVTHDGGDYILWCQYCGDLTPDIIDDAIEIEYDQHQDRLNNQKNTRKIMNEWIKISDQRPPKADETPETDGHYWLLVAHLNDPSKRYVMMWAGSPLLRATHWAKVEPFPEFKEGGRNLIYNYSVI
jgi:hypothetical protein